ncbi:hypothetical protein CEB3_c00990 [Peptococcaceae bacterium CEB3]|nr:hypothetical protein CEB3_c00990 [Peptococcaceae bacterium CEB3]
MDNKLSLRELITKAKDGDAEATAQLISRLVPLVKRHTRRLGYDDAYSELLTWIVEAVQRYQPDTTWGMDELNRYCSRKEDDQERI